jgi:DNA-3-methyladenine glycosylase
MEFTPLPRSFYLPSAEFVAPRLLGHWLVRKSPAGYCGGPVVEVEAYLVGDPASHGFAGQTARTRVMYGPPGFAYVYFIYGNHYCANVVCREPGQAEAVLIRAVEPRFGRDVLAANRPGRTGVELSNGPGKLCQALGIGGELNGADLCDVASPFLLARNPNVSRFRQARGPLITSQRIGISKAVERPLRFHLEGSPFVSRRTGVG